MSSLILQPFIMYKPGILDSLILGLVNQESNRMDPQITTEVTVHSPNNRSFSMSWTSFIKTEFSLIRIICSKSQEHTLDLI